MKKTALLLVALVFPMLSGAQFCVTVFKGEEFGLSDSYNSITVLEIDSSGNTWFGQNYDYGNGDVSMYNGTDWKTVDHASLPDPRPEAIAFNMDDSVWVATRKGIGIIHEDSLDGRQMTPDNSSLPEAYVTAIAVDNDSNKWVGFHSGMVARFNGSVWETFTGISTSSVSTLELAKDGSIWAGFTGSPGLAVYGGSTFNPIPGYSSVAAITADKWGRVLVASHDSMVIYSALDTTVVKAAPGNVIRDIAIGSGTGIWASSGQGLLYRRGDSFLRFSNANSSVPADLSHPLEFDQENDLWFGFHYSASSNWYTGTGFLYRTTMPEEDLVTADRDDLEFCFGDSLTLTADPDGVSYVWPDASTTSNTYVLYDNAEIPVAVEREDRCYFYDTLTATVRRVFEEEVICAASVDTSQKVIIIWERTPEVGTESYNIYREESTNVYEFIGNVPVGSLSVFEDPEADPYSRPYRYKISSVDTCQNESGQSFYHQTLYLATNKGALAGEINLDWEHYEGLSIANYIIFRGTDSLNMNQIATVPGTVTNYTDTDVYDTVYYKVGFVLPAVCSPDADQKAGAGPYHHSLSNLDDNRKMFTGIPDTRSLMQLNAWPNPLIRQARIEFPNQMGADYTFTLYGPSGNIIREVHNITEGELLIQRGDLKPGFYFFELRGEINYQGKILVQ